MGRFGVSLGQRIQKVGLPKMCPRFIQFWHPASHNQIYFVIYHNKNAFKSPGNISGTFLNFLIYSTAEFGVSTRILRNETLATRGYHSADFKVNISIRFLENFYVFTSTVSGATRPRFPIDNSWIWCENGCHLFLIFS